MITPPNLFVGGRAITVDGTLVMGVVNASPESFSDAGHYRSLTERCELCDRLVAAGADIIDVGGQSAITNEPEVPATEEIDRVLPIIEWLHTQHPDILISVDTYKPAVVSAALRAGAAIINDVSGKPDDATLHACREHRAALVVMHTRARPKVRLQDPNRYPDVTADVIDLLTRTLTHASEVGLAPESLIVDPGVDFAKTPHQSVELLRNIDRVRALGRPVLLALSRKDFLGAIIDKPPRGRDAATLAAIAYFAATPGNIVRVHDVAATRDVLRTIDVLVARREVAREYLLPDAIRHEPYG